MLYAIVAVIALILDQLIKYWTTISVIKDEGIVKLIPGLIHLTNVHNTGAAFSFLQGARWFFVALCVVFVAAVIYLLVKNIICTPGARWCAVIVVSGAIGNAIDRIINGYVVDMFEFDFKIFGMNFPVFNLADIYLTIGVLVFCVFLLTEKPEGEQDKAKAGTARPAPPNGPVTYSQPVKSTAPAPVVVKTPKAESVPEKAKAGAPAVKKPPSQQAALLERIGGDTSNKTEQVMRILVGGMPAAETPAAEAAPVPRPAPRPAAAPAPQPAPKPASKPVPASEAEESYNLDDILAEFRDL